MCTLAPRRALWSFLALLPLLASCDATSIGTFGLGPERVTLQFMFDASQVSGGGTVEANPVANPMLAIAVRERYTAGDVVSARVTTQREGPELEIASPLAGRASDFERVEVRLRSEPGTSVAIAEGAGFPAASRAALSVRTADLTSVARAATLTPILVVTPSRPLSGTYIVRVTFDVIVEVEG